jgi:hypothetical protein
VSFLLADPLDRMLPLVGGGFGDRVAGLRGRPTLNDAIVGAWEGLSARAAASCPICDGWMRPIGPPAPLGVVRARCERCGCELT